MYGLLTYQEFAGGSARTEPIIWSPVVKSGVHGCFMRASLLLLGLVTGLFSVVLSPPVLAQGCLPPPENLTMRDLVKRSVETADLVFIGVPKILHGRTEETEDLVILEVSEVFKGRKGAEIGIHSGVGTHWSVEGGYLFEVGKAYLVFANNHDGFLSVAACSLTAPVQKSQVALRFLRKGSPQPEDLLTPKQILRNENGRILGNVRRSDGTPLLDARVYIWNDSDPSYEKEAWLARPDRNGSFESYFLPPGSYRITATDESFGPTRWVGYYASPASGNEPAKVELLPGQDYHWAGITLHGQKVYSIDGVVRASPGIQLPIQNVEIRASMAPTEMFPFLQFVHPDADGKFHVFRVPVGVARLKTYVNPWIDPNWEASVTDVQANGKVENVEIVLKRKDAGKVRASQEVPKAIGR
jgi:hypothetical protein